MKHNPAETVIKMFGGVRPLARALGMNSATPCGWRDRGRIPRWHHDRILAIARRLGLPLERDQLGARYAK
jgi:hypothetical protein